MDSGSAFKIGLFFGSVTSQDLVSLFQMNGPLSKLSGHGGIKLRIPGVFLLFQYGILGSLQFIELPPSRDWVRLRWTLVRLRRTRP